MKLISYLHPYIKMKKIYFILFVFLTINSIAQNKFSTAQEYNDFLVAQQNKIGEKVLVLVNMLNYTTNYDSLMNALNDAIKVSKEAHNTIKKATPFKEGTEMKDACVKLFAFYINTFDKEYRELIKIISSSQITEQDQERLNQIVLKITEEEKLIDADFAKAQEKYAQIYGFQLIPNELQDEIDK